MIGKSIASILSSYTALTALVGTKIFPIIAKSNSSVSLPLVEYTVDSVSPNYAKIEWINDEVGFSVMATATTYSGVNDVATQVRAALELSSGLNGGITTGRIYFDGFTEDYDLDGDSFIMNLRFRTNVTLY